MAKVQTVSTRKKQTNRDKGYVPRREAAHALRCLAARLEEPSDGNLIKFSINVWLVSDDEPETKGQLPSSDISNRASGAISEK